MIEELKALAEKAQFGTLTAMGWGDGSTQMGMTNVFDEDAEALVVECIPEDQATLIVALVNNLPAILSALEAVPVMKEALEQSEQGWENVVEMGLLPPDHWETANNLFHVCSQALAALEPKP
jgi:hypothetical protein